MASLTQRLRAWLDRKRGRRAFYPEDEKKSRSEDENASPLATGIEDPPSGDVMRRAGRF
jgi:hypothetical protein